MRLAGECLATLDSSRIRMQAAEAGDQVAGVGMQAVQGEMPAADVAMHLGRSESCQRVNCSWQAD